MTNEFNADAKGNLNKDDNGKVQSITHFDDPIKIEGANVQEVADQYMTQFGGFYNLDPAELNNLHGARSTEFVENDLELRFENEKEMFDNATVNYVQTYKGLPIFGAGVTLQIKQNPYRVLSSFATNHTQVSINPPAEKHLKKYKSVSVAELKKALSFDGDGDTQLKVKESELNIYHYKASDRVLPHEHEEDGFCHHEEVFVLPALPSNIVEGEYYVVSKVIFDYKTHAHVTPYIVLIDIATDSVLYLRSLSSGLSGFVFNSDPYTMTGNVALSPTATDVQLNPLRSPVELLGLVPPAGGIQKLKGNFIEIKEIELPTIAAPANPAGVNFNYNVRTNEFAAVNAYYHNDRFFRLVTEMGFPATYWGSTVFPLPIDHRGLGNAVNAHCVGNGTNGIGHACYALASAVGTPIGIALDWRVVLHELGGHGILYCSVRSPNFGFAHSAGDSFAAILNDPGNAHADRFATFPWLIASRRHDRAVGAGWAWGGSQDVGSYNSEQILCTTMFRIYRSIGGDSPNLAHKHFAARMTCYLLLRAIGNLTPTHTTQTGIGLARVTAFCNELFTANLGDWTTEGHVGGAYGKVIRWAFEKQGLFQAPGAPTPVATEGKPQPVDVYINDGRNGEYTYQPNFSNNASIWNRRASDGATAHQEPVIGAVNYAYVKIKNRGTQVATGVSVRAFQSKARSGAEYPIDWQPMLTPVLAGANVPANNAGEIIVGPFKWIPSRVGSENITMVVSAAGDGSNTNHIGAGEAIPDWRLIPNDNNIGQRKVSPQWYPI